MNRYQAKAQEILLHNFQVMDLRDAPMSVWGLETAIATALQESENQGIEKAAETSDKWAHSGDCDSHSNNPCCHVRTGAAISEAIRALKGAEEKPKAGSSESK